LVREILNNIISVFKDNNINTEEYFGQLSNPSEPELTASSLPIVFIDYTGDRAEGFERYLKYNLYFVNISYSNNPKYRKDAQGSIIELLQKAQTILFNINSANIDIKQSKKIYDAKVEKGYLVVFTMQIEAQITREETIKWS